MLEKEVKNLNAMEMLNVAYMSLKQRKIAANNHLTPIYRNMLDIEHIE